MSSVGYVVLSLAVLVAPWFASEAVVIDRETMQHLFQCPPCDANVCAIPLEPCELVLEAGICGCCPVCARRSGESCGVTVGRCAQGLKCRPDMSDPNPLNALLLGRAVCIGVETYSFIFEKKIN
ncbi:insulin-like growth factor-binding protein 5 [Haliotis cracherodii]|uniref:insulin-like growth factor-binding protein 5 n=1 Tax=Haliotis cracherodii TaxID=6455 RepID=UPI0039E88DC9